MTVPEIAVGRPKPPQGSSAVDWRSRIRVRRRLFFADTFSNWRGEHTPKMVNIHDTSPP